MPSSSEKRSKFDPTDSISMSRKRGGAVGAPSTSITENRSVKQRWNNIRKSPNDKRDYRGLILSNDMKILLISDPTTDKSAASMDVNVGHMSDPWKIPGLAHLCAHMLFLGTKKYPEKNEYSSFLSQNGGVYNSITRSDSTNYYFDIIPEQLNGALDRFAQFFLSPLFDESATEFGLQAVDSEAAKNMENDTYRINQIDKSTALKNHDYFKFGTGNAQTLNVEPKNKGINVRDELRKFFNHWYSSNIMALSVLGKESLDELEKLVVDLFVNVKNKNTEAAVWIDHPFSEQHYKKKIYIVPIRNVRALRMIFPLPDLDKYYLSVPSQYISEIFNYGGKGSLLSAFKDFRWCNLLIAGPQNTARGNVNFFTVIVDLTEEGMKHINDIIKLTFQYINMIKSTEPHEWIFNEYQEISQMAYDFNEKKHPRDAVKITSRNLQKYPIDELLSVPYLPTEWRPDLIKSLYDYLLPKNIRVHIVAQAYDGIADKTEYWYGTKYSEKSIPDCVIEKWSEPDWPDYLYINKIPKSTNSQSKSLSSESNVYEHSDSDDNTKLKLGQKKIFKRIFVFTDSSSSSDDDDEEAGPSKKLKEKTHASLDDDDEPASVKIKKYVIKDDDDDDDESAAGPSKKMKKIKNYVDDDDDDDDDKSAGPSRKIEKKKTDDLFIDHEQDPYRRYPTKIKNIDRPNQPRAWFEDGQLIFLTDVEEKDHVIPTGKRPPYADWEENEMVRFIYENDHFHHTQSLKTWDLLVKTGLFEHRGSYSLMAHWKRMFGSRDQIKQSGLPKEIRKKLSNPIDKKKKEDI